MPRMLPALTTLALSAALASACAHAQTPTPASWKVSAELSDNGKVVGAPVLIVKSGTPGHVEVLGDQGFVLDMQVDPAGDRLLVVRADAHTSGGGLSTVATLRPGKTATLASGQLGLQLTVSPYTP